MPESIEVWTTRDLVETALTIGPVEPCRDGSEWCPRCRLAEAKTQLDNRYPGLPLTWGDGTLEWAAVMCGKEVDVDRERSDAILNKVLDAASSTTTGRLEQANRRNAMKASVEHRIDVGGELMWYRDASADYRAVFALMQEVERLVNDGCEPERIRIVFEADQDA